MPLTMLIDAAFFPANTSLAHLQAVRAVLEDLMANGTYCQLTPGCTPASHDPRWTAAPLQALPTGFQATSTLAVAANDSVTVVGGASFAGQSLVTLPLTDATAAWTYRAPVPSSKAKPTTLLLANGTRLWVVGGLNGKAPSQTVHVYDVAAGSWAGSLPPWPVALPLPPVAVLTNDTTGVESVVVLDANAQGDCVAWVMPASGAPAWMALAPHNMPDACLSGAGAVGVQLQGQRQMLVLGGTRSDGTCSNRVFAFNPATDAFALVALLPKPVCSPAVQTVDATRLLVVANDGTTLCLHLDTLAFAPLPTAPAMPASTSLVAYSSASDQLLLVAADNTVYTLDHVADTTFKPEAMLQTAAPAPAANAPAHSAAVSRRAVKTTHVAPPPSNDDKPVARFPYISSLLHGYHVLEGNPFATGPDPGWRRASIFLPPANATQAWQNTMSVPGDPYDWLLPTGNE